MQVLSSSFNFKAAEEKYKEQWHQLNLYKWQGSRDFIIDTPPPTISGHLHMGHIFSYCHTDFIARFQRMQGKDVFYPMGFDDNGLPTERLIEKTYKIKASHTPSQDFIKLCEKTSQDSRAEFKDLFNKIGLSVDWEQEYHTNSAEVQKISQASFLDLYKKGLIYRKASPILWDPIDRTAIAQAEVEEKEMQSHMNYIAFTTNKDEKITIATTRPELLPACVAVFYHPLDERYQHLNNCTSYTPLFNQSVPLLPDDKVKPEKGTGLVMCCTFGDELDVEWVEKHALPHKIIINEMGLICNLNILHPSSSRINNLLENLKVKLAREKILELLKENGSLIKQEEITHVVKCAERSGAPLELIPTYQWYIKVVEFKKEFIEIAQKCNWLPPYMFLRLKQWIEGLKWDWCISRQRYLGVPIPIWYDKKTKQIITPDSIDLPIDPKIDIPKGYLVDEIISDKDVMDTWATSSLTPQINAQGLNTEICKNKERYLALYPAHLRPQAHEIIRTWAFYTIVKSYHHNITLPWENIMISGWCLAEDKQKMSKSKGNIIAPLNLLTEFGADVVRYWAATAQLGADTVYCPNIMKMGKKLTSKLWNAARLISPFLFASSKELIDNPLDQWLLSKLNTVVEAVTGTFVDFNYCKALNLVEEFFLRDYCDNYLELSKARSYNQAALGHKSAQKTLSISFKILLKLFAPILPFITEEIYQTLYKGDSIHIRGNWPKPSNYNYNVKDDYGKKCFEILKQVREFKSQKQISIKQMIEKIVIYTEEARLKEIEFDLLNTCNAKAIEWVIGQVEKVECFTSLY